MLLLEVSQQQNIHYCSSKQAYGLDKTSMMIYKRGLALITLLLTCNVALTLATTPECPEGWVSSGFHCYKSFEEAVNWKEAEAHCQSYTAGKDGKAHLASIADIPENALLKGWLEISEKNGTDPWIGLLPLASTEDALHDTWTDGNPADLEIWIEEGVLDDIFMFMEKTCLTLDVNGSWLPTNCNQKRPYVCKLSLCPPGWTSYGGRCFHAFTTKKSWVHAEKHCQSFSAEGYESHLTSIADAMENRFILQLIEDKPQPLWIGLKGLKDDRDQSPIWSEDEKFDLATVSMNGRKTKNNTCVKMHVDDEIIWDDAMCKEELAYVCKISLCRRGWTAFDGTCILFKSKTTQHRQSSTAALDGKKTKGKKRVRRGFSFAKSRQPFKVGQFTSNKFNSKSVPKTSSTTTNYKQQGRTVSTTSTFTSTKFSSTTLTKSKPQMPGFDSESLQSSANLNPAPNGASNSDLRCLGQWRPGTDGRCTRRFSTPMTYYMAKRHCMKYTYTGKDEAGKVIVSTADILDSEYKPMISKPFTCHMAKVYRPANTLY